MPDVLAIGEAMALVHPVAAEPLETAREFGLDVGGAESNLASHLTRLGVAAAWAGAVGDDALGRRLVATLRRRGVVTTWVRVDPSAPTGLYLKDPGAGVLYFRAGSAASRLDADFAAGLPLGDVPWVHLSGITPMLSDGCRRLVDSILVTRRAAGLPVSFDVNHRPALRSAADSAGELLALARRADLVFVGRDEAESLWGTPTAAEAAALLLDGAAGGARVVVKDGDVGATLYEKGREPVFAPSRTVEVVEAIGAGDAFAAGFLAAELEGRIAAESLAAGHDSAAAVLASLTDFDLEEAP